MITINGTPFYETPACCGGCKFIIIGRNDKKGYCSLFEKHKNQYDNIPKRCNYMFEKSFEIGGDVVLTRK